MYPMILDSKELTLAIMQLLTATNDYLTNQIKKAYFYNRYEKILLFYSNKKAISYSSRNSFLTALNRVTVTKILNDFNHLNWIDSSYRKITIIDSNALYNYLNK